MRPSSGSRPSVPYSKALGTRLVTFGNGRTALAFGPQKKINLHRQGQEFEPKAGHPTPGSADLCFITAVPLPGVLRHPQSSGIRVMEGLVRRAGATGPIVSVYFRHPDLNLIEVPNYERP